MQRNHEDKRATSTPLESKLGGAEEEEEMTASGYFLYVFGMQFRVYILPE